MINKSHGVFNGHTWIIVLTAVIGLIALGGGAEFGLVYLLTSSNSSAITGLEALGIPAIPYAVVKGIEMIVKRLTYIPNIDTAETLKEDK